MSAGLIELIGDDILCSIEGGDREARFAVSEARPKLQAWAQRYDEAVQCDNEGELASIGREMFAWLDGSGWASEWANQVGEDRQLEIKVKGNDTPEEIALLDAPWEVLSSGKTGPLALDELQLFTVARRVGDKATPWPARNGDLQLMFVAAAPEGAGELDFEAEEAAIVKATQGLPLRLVVEESGALNFVHERLVSDEAPFEALHLSCHGTIDAKAGPVLLLETPEGDEEKAGPREIVDALGADPPPLIVLSACRTAEFGRASAATRPPGAREGEVQREAGEAKLGPDLATPMARQLVARLPNVLGWDGSVFDADATEFARHFYRQLAGGSSAQRAAAFARRALLRPEGQDARSRRHWHLARVYLGPQGGGALCSNKKAKRQWDAERAFLDKTKQRVPVATRAEFVGRRRATQAVLRAFRKGASGALIHGMGALGKSSLAARVQNRMARHVPVVIFERYDALAIFDAVLEALEPKDRLNEKASWREVVKANPTNLALALETWLKGPLNSRPMLLIIDDLEQILERPTPGDERIGVRADYRAGLGAVLRAFTKASTEARLLVTSRYDFRLAEGGDDLASELIRVPLRPMDSRERQRQWRAAERMAGEKAVELSREAEKLVARALDAAAGNPGLQAILTRPILAGVFPAATTALAGIDEYRRTGAPPAEIVKLIEAGTAMDSDNALIAFFARVSFATYGAALTPDQSRQLGAANLFSSEIPIPVAALAAVGMANGVEAPDKAIKRLIGLGLFDDWGQINGIPHAAANPLARPLAPPLADEDRARLARAAMPELTKAWRDARTGFPFDARAVEAGLVAIVAGAEPAIVEDAAFCGAAWLERGQGRTREARDLIAKAFAACRAGYAFGPRFLRLGCECADHLGDTELLLPLLVAPVRQAELGDLTDRSARAALDVRRGKHLLRFRKIEAAEAVIRDALRAFEAARDHHGMAVAYGEIANITEERGKRDEALRILQTEVLPVFDRLGDMQSRAATMGRIADILDARGEADEALRIREDLLPVFERLGDARSRAITKGHIADILRKRGRLDEATRILREEVLPVFERVGDERSRSVVLLRIAMTLFQMEGIESGRTREIIAALQESLRIAVKLGEPSGIAPAGQLLATVLATDGQPLAFDVAIETLDATETVLRKLGDVKGVREIRESRTFLKKSRRRAAKKVGK